MISLNLDVENKTKTFLLLFEQNFYEKNQRNEFVYFFFKEFSEREYLDLFVSIISKYKLKRKRISSLSIKKSRCHNQIHMNLSTIEKKTEKQKRNDNFA